MPSLVIRDGVHALHGDILLKRTLASIASKCIGVAPPSKSSTNMCMVFLGVAESPEHGCIVSLLIFKCVLVVRASTCQSTYPALVRLASCLRLDECVEWVGFHVCVQ